MVDRLEKSEQVHTPDTTSPAHSNGSLEFIDFEKFLADLSTSFIRVPVEEIDDEIERWIERIVLAMAVDRGNVAQVDPADGAVYTTHQWGREGVIAEQRGRRVEASARFPWLTNKILAGETVVLSRFDELPPEASIDLASAKRMRNKSNITIPLRVGGVVVGAVLFGTVFSERAWSPKEVQRLKLVAEVFGNALERMRAFAEHRRLMEELRQVSQVVTMGELTASLAHELNQPLGAILNNARAARRLLASKTPDLTEVDSALDDIIRDDARAVEIVRNVRAAFRRDGKTSPVDIRELLLDVNRIVSADARMRDIALSIEVPESLPTVTGDKTQLTQAVLNLVLNAFDSVCDSTGPREVVIRAGLKEPGHMHIAVRDSGKGIEEKVMPRLFDPFFTTKPIGMGMGLAIVRSIVENHSGRVWATQNLDRGATLEFALPVEPNNGQTG